MEQGKAQVKKASRMEGRLALLPISLISAPESNLPVPPGQPVPGHWSHLGALTSAGMLTAPLPSRPIQPSFSRVPEHIGCLPVACYSCPECCWPAPDKNRTQNAIKEWISSLIWAFCKFSAHRVKFSHPDVVKASANPRRCPWTGEKLSQQFKGTQVLVLISIKSQQCVRID